MLPHRRVTLGRRVEQGPVARLNSQFPFSDSPAFVFFLIPWPALSPLIPCFSAFTIFRARKDTNLIDTVIIRFPLVVIG